ncbi:MAG TPA: helicase C-terminal domain-containing protein [Verrucomicrobiae bacterium]|nr:helicase C-terminal domain-containing protein [Verrucomicrobiae bacterium]
MAAPESKPVTVSVRDLVEFVLRAGDLGGEGRFVGSDRALAGIRGHQQIQRSRPPEYQAEVPVEHEIDAGEFTLHIRGRIDGLLVTPGQILLEEIKTVHGSRQREADPLHWAQAKCYAFILGRQKSWPEVMIQLVYLELETGRITEFRQGFIFAELSTFFATTTDAYVDWLREQHRWCIERDASIRALAFPFPDYRAGQRELAVAAYRALAEGGRLFLAAPTGIGKTVSVLFPAVKALGEGKLRRIFYLTARTVGRLIAENALAGLRGGGLKLRAVTLTAWEKICVRDGQPCDQLTCPLAIGYYDRIKPAMREALDQGAMTRAVLEAIAQKHQVCPFELSLDVSVWSDAVICDYNYVFDPQAYLRRHFEEEGGDYAFLVDEAHNLVDRARDMFSASLDGAEILAVQRAIRMSVPRCSKALSRLHAALGQLAGVSATGAAADAPAFLMEQDLFPAQSPVALPGESGTSTQREFPASLTPLVETALAEAEAWLVKNQAAAFRESLLTLYFHLSTFRRTAALYDTRFVTIFENAPEVTARLFCLDPSELLRRAQARGQTTIFFSATLAPLDYYRTLLGGGPEDPVLQLSSPFPPEHLGLLVQDRINTSFKGRAESLQEVAQTVATFVRGRRGNYLVYFPSFQYLNGALKEFQDSSPAISVLVQRPGMTESQREAYLAAFSVEHGETLVGFAVLGGIFGEGIDLVGERLIGAVIVGVGLPQLCTERDLIRDYFESRNVAGFDFAYVFPGMNRVLQAVGRVIRSRDDCGMVLLIDERFGELRYRRLFPAWWQAHRVRNLAALDRSVDRFWKRQS